MPDAYGNPTEEELRNRQVGMSGPPALLGNSDPMQLIYSGNVGGHNVQTYGTGPQLTQEQATSQLAGLGSNQFASDNGSLDPNYWAALNPNGDADAYRRLHEQYRAQTEGQSTEDRIGNAVNFELDRAGNLIKGVANDPSRLLTGVDPLSTNIHNSVLGTDKKPLVGQLGGATEDDFNRYEQRNGFGSLGAARSGTTAANYIAGMFGAVGAANGIGNALGSLGNGPTQFTVSNEVGGLSSALPEGVGPQVGGIGGNASAGFGATGSGFQGASSFAPGMQVGGGNAGQLAAAGGISGGAGTGIGGSLGGGSGWLSQGNVKNYADLLGGLTGGGNQGGGQSIPYVQALLGNNQQQSPQAAQQQFVGLPVNTQIPFIPPKGYRQRNFLGSTIWS